MAKRKAKRKKSGKIVRKRTDNREKKYFSALKAILFNPAEYFEEVKNEKGLRKPLIFLLKTCLMAGVILTSLLTLAGLIITIVEGKIEMLGILFAGGIIISLLFTAVELIGVFLISAIYHLLMLMFNVKGRYENAFKAVAYSEAPMGPFAVILLIPILSTALGVWRIILRVFALMPFYRTSGGKAAAVVIIPVVALLLIALLLFVAFAAAM